MSRTRSRVIAIQALIVGALALVIVLTLLQPDGDEPLFGISAPEENTDRPVIERDRGDRATGQRGERRGAGQHDGGALALPGPQAPSGASQSFAEPSGADTTASPGSAQPTGSNGGDSPTSDQYDDTLARLAAKLH